MALEDRYRRIPFDEAIDFLRQKINVDTDSSYDILDAEHDALFCVAGAKGSVLSELREAVTRAIADGQRLEDFQERFNEIAEGWEHKGDAAWRARVIYQTNMRMAHAAGRYQQQLDPAVLRVKPYLQCIHGGSAHPRPSHLALDKKVFRAQDCPIYFPSGYGCACRTISLSDRDLSRFGLEVSTIARGDRVEVEVDGKIFNPVIEPDQGFDYVPGQSSQERRQEIAEQMLARMSPDIREQVAENFADINRAMEQARSAGQKQEMPRSPDQTYQNIARQLFAKELKAVEDALNPKPRSPSKNLQAAIAKLEEARATAAKTKDKIDIAVARALEVQIEKMQQQQAALPAPAADPLAAMAELRKALFARSQISEEGAANLAKRVRFNKEAIEEAGSIEVQRQRVADVARLTNGRMMDTFDKILFFEQHPRAFALKPDRAVIVGRYPPELRDLILYHELGHHFEFSNPHIAEDAYKWMLSRSNGKPARPLSEIEVGSSYGPNELAFEDDWYSTYVGKVPGAVMLKRGIPNTEVISMGLQKFTSPEAMLEFYRKDPDHFLFVLGSFHRAPLIKNAVEVLNQPELEARREVFVEQVGRDRVEAVERKYSELLARSEIQIRLPTPVLDQIIASGRFRSSVELEAADSNSKGDVYDGKRRAVERDAFGGTYEQRGVEERPIYGYLADAGKTPYEADDVGALDRYGRVAVRLKPEASDRTTTTYGDSFGGTIPSPVQGVNIASIASNGLRGNDLEELFQRIESATSLTDLTNGGYIEAQVHGQVRVTDIAEIWITELDELSPAVLEWARINNVKISTYSREDSGNDDFEYVE